MIAVDSSTWAAYFTGITGADVELLERALTDGVAALPAPVLTELLSAPRSDEIAELLAALPLLLPGDGFWARAGELRARALRAKRRARLADALIAQLCLDHGVALITRDRDFRAFADLAGLDVAVP